MPLRPAKRGQKYVATIEVRGPVENKRAFRAFRKALANLAKKKAIKAKLKQKRAGR